jgi:hypothetical protein
MRNDPVKKSYIEDLKNKSGLYIVTLNNDLPISVNANDKRIADKCIHVNKLNCKFGKAKCLHRRQNNYYKVFGKENTNYQPIVLLEEISLAEKLILKRLLDYRLRGQSGRLNEWLFNITTEELILIIVSTLKENNMTFEIIV